MKAVVVAHNLNNVVGEYRKKFWLWEEHLIFIRKIIPPKISTNHLSSTLVFWETLIIETLKLK